jgi:predicted ester cyclase
MMGGREIPATGRRVQGHGTYFARVDNGRIVEFSTHPNVAEMMMQLGLMPQD